MKGNFWQHKMNGSDKDHCDSNQIALRICSMYWKCFTCVGVKSLSTSPTWFNQSIMGAYAVGMSPHLSYGTTPGSYSFQVSIQAPFLYQATPS